MMRHKQSLSFISHLTRKFPSSTAAAAHRSQACKKVCLVRQRLWQEWQKQIMMSRDINCPMVASLHLGTKADYTNFTSLVRNGKLFSTHVPTPDIAK